jgi:hypothetical protein
MRDASRVIYGFEPATNKHALHGTERIAIVRCTAINAAAIVAAIGMAAAIHGAARAADTASMAAAGSKAPPVVGKSVYAGKIEDFDMSKALASGAVVLYFFPKAFTEG